MTSLKWRSIYMLFLNCVCSAVVDDTLYVSKDGEFSSITTYADCVQYNLLVAELRNISLPNAQKFCNNMFLEHMRKSKEKMYDPNVANYVSHLLRGVHAGIEQYKKRKKRSIFAGSVQTRKEVREPPYDQNWGCYVRGVRRLKHNYDVRPDMNTYDVLANLHTADEVIPTAHDGPGFFSWHREYLRIMELAIGCPIPYWDTTLDFAMKDPSESVIWSDKYFGNPYGLVITGIMKGLPTWLPIIRNINSDGWLISRRDISMALSKPSLFEFTEASPCEEDDRSKYSWECFHKGIHDWIDGTIGPSNTTTFDPIFFPLHAFIDKIFEIYRQKLISKGIDPERNFPTKAIKHHGPDHKMIWVPIYPDIEHLTNRQGYGDELASLTKYSLGPRCPDCSNSDDLYCDKPTLQCVSKTLKSEEKYTLSRIGQLTEYGIKFIDVLEPESPDKVTRLADKLGPLPFGKKFNVGSRDPRTRNNTVRLFE